MDIKRIAAALVANDSNKIIDDAVEDFWQHDETDEWKGGLQWGLEKGPESMKDLEAKVEKALGRELTEDEADRALTQYEAVTDREYEGTYKKLPRFTPEEEKMMEADRQIDAQKDRYPEQD